MSFNHAPASKEPTVTVIDDQHPTTPLVKSGETIVIGVDPKSVLPKGFKHEHVAKVNLKGIAPHQLSRAALAITPQEDGTIRVQVLSDAHVVKIWSTDQMHPNERELFQGHNYPDRVMRSFGQYPGIDITTADNTVIRIDYSSGSPGISKAFNISVPNKSERQFRGKIRLEKFRQI